MTLIAFEPSPELVAFVRDAAHAAAVVVNDELDARRQPGTDGARVPVVLPSQITGSLRWKPVARARRVLVALIRQHVFIDRGVDRNMLSRCQCAIAFGGLDDPARPIIPQPHKAVQPISLPMVGFLLGRDHSGFVAKRLDDGQGIPELVARAEEWLSAWYPDGTRIVRDITFHGRVPKRARPAVLEQH